MQTGDKGMARERGFTLIELLVVMAIIATLLMIALPRYFESLERAKETTLRQDLSVMRESIDKFAGDTGRWPESLDELVEARYLRAIPQDPITGSADTWIEILSEDVDSPGIRDVQSGADGEAKSGIPYREL
jgi:general secretion pathway protein G